LMMPEMSGPTAIQIIKERHPKIKIIALTAVEQPRDLTPGLINGVDGYLFKRISKAELRLAINRVMQGERYLCPGVADSILNAYLDERRHKESPISRITAREREVLELSCMGLKGKAIADRLCISIKTVEKHLANLRAKLKVNTIAEMATAYTRWKDATPASLDC
jgi:DNA-binding NarL/FixJ family response regulator